MLNHIAIASGAIAYGGERRVAALVTGPIPCRTRPSHQAVNRLHQRNITPQRDRPRK